MYNCHVLITGPSGAGKTTLARHFRSLGENGVDADTAGIGKWMDGSGNEFRPPADSAINAGQWAFDMGLRWNWDVSRLVHLLGSMHRVYLFGGAYNIYGLSGLFCRRYYLDADAKLLEERLESRSREGKSHVGWGETKEHRAVILAELDADRSKAAEHGLRFIDASLPIDRIFRIIVGIRADL